MASKERLEQARPMLMLDCEDALILFGCRNEARPSRHRTSHENMSPVERRHLALGSDLIESLDLRSPTVGMTVWSDGQREPCRLSGVLALKMLSSRNPASS